MVTSDCAAMLREIDIQHPAAKLIAQAAKTQETEIGDNTCFTAIFAGELLIQAENLIKMGLHTADIIKG